MISPEQRQKAIKLYRNKGLTLREIANLCDISLPSLEILVRQAVEIGILKPRDIFRKEQSKETKFTDDQLREIANDYYEKKMTRPQLEEKWGIHPMQLQRVRNRFANQYEPKVIYKEVCQYDKKGNLISEFANGNQASIITGINRLCINRACRGESKSAGGYLWRFKDND